MQPRTSKTSDLPTNQTKKDFLNRFRAHVEKLQSWDPIKHYEASFDNIADMRPCGQFYLSMSPSLARTTLREFPKLKRDNRTNTFLASVLKNKNDTFEKMHMAVRKMDRKNDLIDYLSDVFAGLKRHMVATQSGVIPTKTQHLADLVLPALEGALTMLNLKTRRFDIPLNGTLKDDTVDAVVEIHGTGARLVIVKGTQTERPTTTTLVDSNWSKADCRAWDDLKIACDLRDTWIGTLCKVVETGKKPENLTVYGVQIFNNEMRFLAMDFHGCFRLWELDSVRIPDSVETIKSEIPRMLSVCLGFATMIKSMDTRWSRLKDATVEERFAFEEATRHIPTRCWFLPTEDEWMSQRARVQNGEENGSSYSARVQEDDVVDYNDDEDDDEDEDEGVNGTSMLQESGTSDDQAAAVLSYVANELEVMSSTMARLNRKLAVEEATQRIQDKELRVLAKEQKGSESIDKMELLCKQKQVFYGQQRYTLRKFLEGSAATGAKRGVKGTEDTSQIKMTEPTLYRPELVPGGTDPSAKTLFETVAVPAATLITLQNSFDVLSRYNEEEIAKMDKGFHDSLAPSRVAALERIKIPDAHKTTVARIRHDSGLTNQQQHRNRQLKNRKFKKVLQWYDELAKLSMHRADTIDDVEQAARKRRQATDVLQEFEQSGTTRNKRHHTQLRLRRAFDHIAAREMDIFQHANIDQKPSQQHLAMSPTATSSTTTTSSTTPIPNISPSGFCTPCLTHHGLHLSPKESQIRWEATISLSVSCIMVW
ncbi:hypothetical protein BGZ83_006768 [Gryganskiella cystojenkinii]|nr:hypothetical protein BGZ83_006768 [Gryganskiella cystojenkinii]